MRNFLSKEALSVAVLVTGLVIGVLWGTSQTEIGVERAVRQNFIAAGLLSRLQVEAEKLRRYEKEMFIYVANPEKRANYIKEFDASYTKMLPLLDTMLAPSGTAFNDEERKEITAWKNAAVFYTGQFYGLGRKADGVLVAQLSNDQRLGLTTDYNEAIKAGKDQFRILLAGTEKMRVAKEAAAQSIATEIDSTFTKLRLGVVLGGLLIIGMTLFALRSRGPVPVAQRGVPVGLSPLR
jgi:hypothetical protein